MGLPFISGMLLATPLDVPQRHQTRESSARLINTVCRPASSVPKARPPTTSREDHSINSHSRRVSRVFRGFRSIIFRPSLFSSMHYKEIRVVVRQWWEKEGASDEVPALVLLTLLAHG